MQSAQYRRIQLLMGTPLYHALWLQLKHTITSRYYITHIQYCNVNYNSVLLKSVKDPQHPPGAPNALYPLSYLFCCPLSCMTSWMNFCGWFTWLYNGFLLTNQFGVSLVCHFKWVQLHYRSVSNSILIQMLAERTFPSLPVTKPSTIAIFQFILGQSSWTNTTSPTLICSLPPLLEGR